MERAIKTAAPYRALEFNFESHSEKDSRRHFSSFRRSPAFIAQRVASSPLPAAHSKFGAKPIRSGQLAAHLASACRRHVELVHCKCKSWSAVWVRYVCELIKRVVALITTTATTNYCYIGSVARSAALPAAQTSREISLSGDHPNAQPFSLFRRNSSQCNSSDCNWKAPIYKAAH